VVRDGLPALSTLLEEFRQNGGKVRLCGACTKPRGITAEHTAPGVSIVGAATIVEAIAKGATPVAFAWSGPLTAAK
jgi:sulfur relay (sulfurtransferase) complex TusBCD TusD component (DsrE family)